MTPTVGTRDEWLVARRELLIAEKQLTRLRDEQAARRRALPWVRIDEEYLFDTESGRRNLLDLFDGRSQLAVYHFMFGPGWDEGCPSCSFWMDNLNGTQIHLAHRDVTLVAASRAPLDRLLAYRTRMDWSVPWVSSAPSSFNVDFGVSFPPGEPGTHATYNFAPVADPAEEAPGFSAFARIGDAVFHTYSAYARGLETLNGAYHLLDLMPRGRDEADLPWTMAWLHRHDQYPDDGRTID